MCPTLDVTEALTAPELQDSFTVTSTTRAIGAGGVSIDTATSPTPTFGTVVPNKSTLVRLPDGSRLAASIDIYTRYALTDGSRTDDVNSQAADIVTWRNRKYVVCAVEDWSDFGQGFIHAAADLLPFGPPAS